MIEREQKLLILAFIIGLSLMMMNVITVAIAIPKILQDIPFKTISAHWIVNSYAIAMAISGIAIGKCADIYPPKNMIITGFILFIIGSLGCIISTHAYEFVVFRFIQGISSLLINIAGVKLLSIIFSKEKLSAVLGIVGGSAAIIAAIIPTITGIIIYYANWRWFFIFNIPFCLLSMYIIFKTPSVKSSDVKIHFDYRGFAFLTIFLFTLTFNIMEFNYLNLYAISLLTVIAIISLSLFVLRSMSISFPLIDLEIFKIKNYSISLVIISLTHAYSLTTVFWVMYMQKIIFLNTIQAGFYFSVFWLCFAISGFLSSRIIKVEKPYPPLFIGLVITFVGYSLSTLLLGEKTYLSLLPVMVLAGMGFNFILNPLRVIAIHAVQPEKRGMALGLINNIRHIICVILFAIFSGIISYFQSSYINEATLVNEGFLIGFEWIMGISSIICLICILFSFSLKEKKVF